LKNTKVGTKKKLTFIAPITLNKKKNKKLIGDLVLKKQINY